MADYSKKSQVTQLQRSVNAVATAATNYLSDQNLDNLGTAGFGSDLDNFIKNYLGCNKVYNSAAQVFASSYKNSSGVANFGSAKCGKLQTGASLCIRPYKSYGNSAYEIVVDVNGTATPNSAGRDYFVFALTPKGRITPILTRTGGEYNYATGEYSRYEYEAVDGSGCVYGYEYGDCFAKIMDDGWQMNY